MSNSNYHTPSARNDAQNFTIILQSLKKLLEREKTCLQAGNVNQLESFANEKIRIFVSLNHLAQSVNTIRQNEVSRSEVQDVASMLNENLDILKLRINAISEIAQNIEEVINDAESDGTYQSHGGY